jgi:hypothetical protein
MAPRGGTIRNILVWSYERGTLPYDILCGLILAFIFFVPRSCFAPKKPELEIPAPSSQSSVTSGNSQTLLQTSSRQRKR